MLVDIKGVHTFGSCVSSENEAINMRHKRLINGELEDGYYDYH